MTLTTQIPSGLIDGSPSLDHISSESHPERDVTYAGLCRTLALNQYQKAKRLYAKVDELTGKSYSDRLDQCRSGAWFVYNTETREVRVRSSHCHLRFCPMCNKAKRALIQENLLPVLESAPNLRFMTLTLKHSYNDLGAQIDALLESWARLRRHKEFRRMVRGGVFFVQITRNKEAEQWHPHLHILLTGVYFPHATLKNLWFTASKGSSIVDIRKAIDREKSCEYVARYATQCADLLPLSDDEGVSLIRSVRGRKLAGTFGSFRGVRLTFKKPDGPDNWTPVQSFVAVIVGRTKMSELQILYNCWLNRQPLPPDWCMPSEDTEPTTNPDDRVPEPIRYLFPPW